MAEEAITPQLVDPQLLQSALQTVLSPIKAALDTNESFRAAEVDEPTENNEITETDLDTEIDNPDDLKEGRDYAKIFEKYQDRFNRAYAISKKLFITEKSQRQTLNYYHRRNNTLLDLLDKFEEDDNGHDPFEINVARVANIIDLNPQLGQSLTPLLNFNDNQTVKKSYKVNLLVGENVPELVNDDLDTIEQNPQDTDPWVRRNYSHLVKSKFKSIDVMSKGVKENAEAASLASKKRKKLPKDEAADTKRAKK